MAFAVLAAVLGPLGLSQSTTVPDPPHVGLNKGRVQSVASTPGSIGQLGQKLFDRNCAHCHGDDARGDEGPNLHHLKLSDVRIAKRIKDGVKGEMPSFGSKLDDRDVAALTAYLRSLKD
jgi:mono/diheme cytochrome c family protein